MAAGTRRNGGRGAGWRPASYGATPRTNRQPQFPVGIMAFAVSRASQGASPRPPSTPDVGEGASDVVGIPDGAKARPSPPSCTLTSMKKAR